MSLSYTVTLAARFASEEVSQGRDDAARVMLEPTSEAVVCVLATGSETGWDAGRARISRVVLDAFAEVIEMGSPSIEFAFERAFMRASRRLIESYEAEHGERFGSGVAEWSATALGMALLEDRAELCWAGSDAAVLVRDGRVVARTRPDVLAMRHLQPGASMDDIGADPRHWVMTCALPFVGADEGSEEVSWQEPSWRLAPGDVVVVGNASFWMQTPEEVLARLLAENPLLDAETLLAALPDTSAAVSVALARVFAGSALPS